MCRFVKNYVRLNFPCQFIWQEKEIVELKSILLAFQSLLLAGQARRGAKMHELIAKCKKTVVAGISLVGVHTFSVS